jgi:hypothetical protein
MLSPFNEITTHMLSPMIVKDQCIFLYSPAARDGFEDTDYNVLAHLTQGTIGIHTATTEAYHQIFTYLTNLYGPYHDDDEECIFWECPKPKST